MNAIMDRRELLVDATRVERADSTGIYVRAMAPDGTYGSHDIAVLTRASLISWLRCRGGSNDWAEGVVAVLLGHTSYVEAIN